MNQRESNSVERLGELVGCAFGYALFTVVVYFVLTTSGKLPTSWALPHLAAATLAASSAGALLKNTLK